MHCNLNIAATLAISLLAATPAYAGDSANEINQRIGSGDPVAGKDKAALCQGCHGEDGNSVSGDFPKLSGQWADYIQKQVREFQNGARYNAVMTDMAMSVNDFQDMFDIAAYFASQKQMGGTPIEDEAERKLYLEGQQLFYEGNERTGAFRCVKCHGEEGKGEPLNNNLFPVLGGQHKDYLIRQLTDFKHEVRENDRSGFMLRITTHLTAQDIEALATYLSHVTAAPAPVAPVAVAAPAPVAAPVPVAVVTPVPVTVSESSHTLLEDKPVRIKGTNFASGSAKLKGSVVPQLDGVVEFANAYPNATLEIYGHTSSTGSEKLNINLSVKRAETVKTYLMKHGVAPGRIITKGMGSTEPIADNKTKAGRAMNRRVEIRSTVKQQVEALGKS